MTPRMLPNPLRRAASRRLRAVVDRAVREEVRRRLAELPDSAELAELVDRRAGAVAAALVEAHRAAAPHERPSDPLRTYQVFTDPAKVHLHPTADVNNALLNVESGEITVEEYAFFGHNVCVLTGTHDIAARGLARQQAVPAAGRDVVVRTGAWVGSNATVLGPAVIGAHAVVAAGAVVTGDVPAYTVVAGVPARRIATVPGPAD